MGRRYNRYGERLLLQGEDATVWSVPPQWTDLVIVDPEVVIGGSHALFRISDLLELAALVDRISGRSGRVGGRARKDNYAASVKLITPQGEAE